MSEMYCCFEIVSGKPDLSTIARDPLTALVKAAMGGSGFGFMKAEDVALRFLAAETTMEVRPMTIRPGKPVRVLR